MRKLTIIVASSSVCVLGMGLSAAAAIPPPGSPLARQEAQQLDQLPAVAPSGKAQIDHTGRKQKGNESAAERRSPAGCRRGCFDAAASSAGDDEDAIACLREAIIGTFPRAGVLGPSSVLHDGLMLKHQFK